MSNDTDMEAESYEKNETGIFSSKCMDASAFRKHGKEMIDYVANYMETVHLRRVTPEVQPGYLAKLLPENAPETGEKWSEILRDVETAIMPGITHWQHPNFHAYFPSGNSFPSILADLLSDGIGCIGFSWAASPACTELEMIVLNWLGNMIGLPKTFLHGNESSGGGVIQGSASDCILVSMLAARHRALLSLKNVAPQITDQLLLSKLVGYCSNMAHSAVEKAGMISMVKIRELPVDDDFSLRGPALASAIKEDKKLGLIPFYACATLGTTSCCSFDNIHELGTVCAEEGIWLHVDGAYAGNALICQEYKYLIRGIRNADSFNMNPNKWMMVNFDCSTMWTKDKCALENALTVNPIYLKHAHSGKSVDFRHWGIPLSRRFRSLKLWFVIRTYGVDGIRKYIRNHIQMAEDFEKKVKTSDLFEIIGHVTMGLVCFRLKGDNILTQELLHVINASGKLHMVPAMLNEKYVIRYAICSQEASLNDNTHAWSIIQEYATLVMEATQNNVMKGIEDEKQSDDFDDDEDEVFGFTEEVNYINQISSGVLQEKSKRNALYRMISDPKCYNPKVMKSLSQRSHEVADGIESSAKGILKRKRAMTTSGHSYNY